MFILIKNIDELIGLDGQNLFYNRFLKIPYFLNEIFYSYKLALDIDKFKIFKL